MRDLPQLRPQQATRANRLIEQSQHLIEHSHTLREQSRQLRAFFRKISEQAGRAVTGRGAEAAGLRQGAAPRRMLSVQWRQPRPAGCAGSTRPAATSAAQVVSPRATAFRCRV